MPDQTSTPDAPAPDLALREKIADHLKAEFGDTYDCTRVWEAWSVGTMTDEDFEPVTDRLDSIVLDLMTIIERHAAALRAERDEAQPVAWPIEARRLLDAAQQMTIAIGMGWDLDGVIEGLREQVDAAEKLGIKPSQDHYAPPAAAVEPGAAGGLEPERCPHCGYTAEDKALWLDHSLCPGRRALDGEKR